MLSKSLRPHYNSSLSISEKDRNKDNTAKLAFISQNLSKWYLEAKPYVSKSSEYQLTGLSYTDFLAFLSDTGDMFDKTELYAFFVKSGGLALAAALLKAASAKTNEDLVGSSLLLESADTIQNMLFNTILANLEVQDREFVETASILESFFSIEDLNLILEKPLRSKAQILALIPRCLFIEQGNQIQLHDSIRPLAYSLLSDAFKEQSHLKMITYYQKKMDENGKLFELIDRWGFHLCRCLSAQSDVMKKILALSSYEVFSLWGLHYRGFPFAFDRENYQDQFALIAYLISEDLIETSIGPSSSTKTFDVSSPPLILD